MNVLVLKLGMHYTPFPKLKHAALGEVDSIVNLFVQNDHDVTIVCDTAFCPTESISYINVLDNLIYSTILANESFDLLIVCNGLINDRIDKFNSIQYDIINTIECPVIFMYCDMALPFRKMSLTRTDINCITQGQNREIIWRDLALNTDLYPFEFERMSYFPFQQFPLANNIEFYNIFKSHRHYDLMYGGGFREGRRRDDMIKWYFNNPNLSVTLFGNIELQMFNNIEKYYPIFLPSVDYDKFIDKMSESFATIIIIDPLYKKYGSLTQRIYESALARCIVFIDESCDPKHILYGNTTEFSKLLYLSEPNQVYERINILKHDHVLYIELIMFIQKKLLYDLSLEDFKSQYIHNFRIEIQNICK